MVGMFTLCCFPCNPTYGIPDGPDTGTVTSTTVGIQVSYFLYISMTTAAANYTEADIDAGTFEGQTQMGLNDGTTSWTMQCTRNHDGDFLLEYLENGTLLSSAVALTAPNGIWRIETDGTTVEFDMAGNTYSHSRSYGLVSPLCQIISKIGVMRISGRGNASCTYTDFVLDAV